MVSFWGYLYLLRYAAAGCKYSNEDEPGWVKQREQGYQRAIKLLERSSRYVRIIAAAPFVRGIAISGSLSKYYASPSADIDYFIITESGRLWIARTILHLFKKLTFITGHQHFFCMNYFVDKNSMVISHPNLYSAVETVTVLPVYNEKLILQFIESNLWTREYLPNYTIAPTLKYTIRPRKHPLKKLAEALIRMLGPEKINHWLMRLTDRKWRKKWKGHGYSAAQYNKAFQTELGISKNHPADFERKVLHELKDYA
ncbi:MAG: hypothetical protein P8100_14985 [bacterium]